MKILRNRWFIGIIAALVGALVILVIRLFTYSPELVHYHANFAVYINDVREEFKDPSYYQEVSACSALKGLTQPIQRAHMHDGVNAVIHVHDYAVTWGQFFANLGWALGPNFIENTSGTLYQASGPSQLHLVLNSNDITGSPIDNAVIRDQDRLLISYGELNASTLQREYQSVPATAHHYDVTKDPASCSGAEKVTTSDRLKHLF